MCVASRYVWVRCVVRGAPKRIRMVKRRGGARVRVSRRERRAGCGVGDGG